MRRKLFVVSFQTLLVLLRIASNFLIVLDRKRQKEHVLLSKFSYVGAPEQNVQKVQEKLPQRTDNVMSPAFGTHGYFGLH